MTDEERSALLRVRRQIFRRRDTVISGLLMMGAPGIYGLVLIVDGGKYLYLLYPLWAILVAVGIAYYAHWFWQYRKMMRGIKAAVANKGK